ncbi:beta-lactamase family protein [Paraglaciecola chathamensis]|uniref:Beta-lactamase family protein n=1 Tax=Paraglaciecola chathamensis TaxID=368405 RepID=A0ABS0WKU7_9ALTE|nr:serine hydrolase domain-containing protein [Paraglaciecola chathamensis]MBJ2139053.1 beta-lactamase family protein [Paraglaciecola chathamensis]MDO6840159.1 serine hydrolase domain-containing protein [Paraglaciecola chathamensis]
MFKSFLLISLIFSNLIYSSASGEEWLDDFAKRVKTKTAKQRVPGYLFAFIEEGKPAKMVVSGKTANKGSAITPQTVFRLASVSKTFTSILMAKMVDENKLSWQTPVKQMTSEYDFDNSKNLQLAHIVGQSSGFSPNAYDNLIEANYPVKRVLSMLTDLKPLCTPGECYTYQNTLFGVIEEYFQENNTSYGEQLESEVLRPLSMKGASVGRDGLVAADSWAKPHVAIAKNKWRSVKVNEDYYRFSPAAGVNASGADMVKWVGALLGEQPNVIGPQIIDQVTQPRVKTKREMHRRLWQRYLKDAHYGLGWRVYDFDGHKLNYHGGWVKGYRAAVAFAPDQKVGYFMLMNAESNLINDFTADFWASYFKHYDDQQKLAAK